MRVRLKHERLAEELAKRPVTLNRWAQLMGVSSGHLSQLVNGRRPHPTASTRRKILSALELDFEELFEVEHSEAAQESAKTRRRGKGAGQQQSTGFSDEGSPQPVLRKVQRRGKKESTMEHWMLDLLWGLRSLIRRPGSTALAVLTLALGIGANVALFSLVNAALFAAYPYPEAKRVYTVRNFDEEQPRGGSNFSYLDYLDFQERLTGTLDLAAWDWEPYSLSGGDRPQRVGGARTTSNFAQVFGLEMLRGRFFTEEELQQRASVLVIGEGLWRSSFGADPAIVGREVMLDGEMATVIGVAPKALDAIDRARVFVPLQASTEPATRESHWLGAFGRLAPGVGEAAAQQRLAAVAAEVGEQHPQASGGRNASMEGLRSTRTQTVRTMLLSLQALVLVVLLIVCANVAGLLLSRGTDRESELRLRAALGANRARLLRQLLVESGLLALLGLAVGLPLGLFGSRLLPRLVPPERIPTWMNLSPGPSVWLFAVGLTVVSLLLFALFPALRQSKELALHSRHNDSNRASLRARRGLVVAEVALAMVLLMVAGLMIRSMLRLASVQPGFRVEGAVVAGLDLLSMRGKAREEREERFLEYYERFQALPGVLGVGAIDRMPLRGGRNITGLTAETPDPESYDPFSLASRVTPGYFAAAGIPLLEGREFDLASLRREDMAATTAGEAVAEDAGAGMSERQGPDARPRREIVVSRKMANALWPESGALGQRVKFARPTDEAPWYEVIGVVGDVRHVALEQEPIQTVYISEGSLSMTRAQWVLRSRASTEVLIPALRSAVAEIDPNQPLWGIETLDQTLESAMWSQRLMARLFWTFAALAGLLAVVGVYGVLAYAVGRRRYEMGVRIALGATRARVAGMVISDGLRLVFLGLLIGIPIALLSGRALTSLLYGARSMDLGVLLAVVLLLAAAGLLAAWLPARRAARLEANTLLRSE